jgi:hypothetical protein
MHQVATVDTGASHPAAGTVNVAYQDTTHVVHQHTV